MKKILFSAAALLTMLFAASCQKEDFSGADGEFATVTLTVQAPASPSTKALGDGTKAKNLVFGVFDENGAELTDLRQGDWMNANQTEITFNDQLQAKVTVNLAKGKTYTFICWAQTKEYGDATNPTAVTCYDFKNLDDIKVDYTVNNEANNEHRDAFYACVTSGIIKKDYSTTITLTRPFGQLNIGTNDMAAAQSAGLDLANLWVELSVTNCPTHLVADMTKHVYTVDGSVTAKFTKALCPASVNLAETLNVDQDGDKAFAENEKYGWLSMNYIFTAHQEVKDDATKNITFDLYEGDLSLAKYSRDNVPFIANYRTNLLGRLLTTDGDITVIIDPVPDGDENITGGIEDVSVITLDELNAVTAAGTYNVGGTLTKDGVKSAAMGAGYEDVEIKDADNKTATYTLKVPASKADGEYEAYYKAGGYLIVAVDAAVAEDGKVTLKAKDTHVAYVPEGIEDEEEEEPALKATLAVDPATIALEKADAATVKFTVTAENCTWTATCDNENVKFEIAENVVNVTVPANEDTEKEATYVVTVTPAVEEGVETCEPVTVTITQAKKEAAVEPEPTEVVLYLVPNANWNSDNARFAAYFFGNGEIWVDMTDEDGDGVYELVVPDGFKDIIFCRMKPDAAENNWNNKWNQTSDLKVPTDGTNCYTVAEGAWDKGEGTWSTFPPATEPEEPEEPVDNTLTVAEFLEKSADESVYYTLKGTITSVANTTYGNFDLTDDTGTVYIYGLMSEDGATNKYWAASGAKLGDDIVISVPRTDYNGTPQGKNARFIELVSPGTRAFYNLSTEAVNFASAGGEQVVTVTAYNTEAAVTATSDNAQFDVTVNGYDITISSVANELEEEVTGNVTVKVGDLDEVVVKVSLAAKPASGVVEGGNSDFNTISATNTSYVSGTTTAGWAYENCAIFKGGTSDSSPSFVMIGDESNRALCINGKTTAKGTITSPILTTGCGTLKFNYGLPFSDTKIKFTVDIIQNSEIVKTFTVENLSATKLTKYSFEETINVAGEFQIVFTNQSPSNNTGNKDRTAIWDVEWTGYSE